MPKNLNIEIPIMPAPEGDSKTPSPAVRVKPEVDLNILLKFIKPYDGSRETINSFLTNCNNAYELANDSQRPILFKYILSQLQGKAEVAASIKDFQNYEQLKDFLKLQFSQRKHYSHLITDLQECKQQLAETVVQFSTRIETILTQLLTEISLNPTKKLEIAGRTAAMEDLALHHFLMGLHPRISNIVRCKSPKNLNEAIGFAISEEKIQQTLYRKPENSQKEKKPFNNNNKFSTSQRPFRSPQGSSNNYNTNFKPSQPQYNRPFQGQSQYIPRQFQGQPHQNFVRPPQGPNNSFIQRGTTTQNFKSNPHHSNFNNNRQRINFVEDNIQPEEYYCETEETNCSAPPEPEQSYDTVDYYDENDQDNDDNNLNE